VAGQITPVDENGIGTSRDGVEIGQPAGALDFGDQSGAWADTPPQHLHVVGTIRKRQREMANAEFTADVHRGLILFGQRRQDDVALDGDGLVAPDVAAG